MHETLYALLETLSTSVATLASSGTGRLTRERTDALLGSWSEALVKHARIELSVHGRENVDWSRAYLVMSNHQSHYDIPVLFHVVPKSMRGLAKKELFRVPIWGRAMRDAGFIAIDRTDREKAIASLKRAGRLVAEGVNLWLAPEGTRSRSGKLGPLKKGGFHLALETGTPILPIAISGTHAILPPETWTVNRGKKVTVVFGEPVVVQGKTLDEIMESVRTFFLGHIE